MRKYVSWTISLIVCLVAILFLAAPGNAIADYPAIEITGIPTFGQRLSYVIPEDINPHGITVTVSVAGGYADCGIDCAAMIEGYFKGYGNEDDHVYHAVIAARNPTVDWVNVTYDPTESITVQPFPMGGYTNSYSMSAEDIYSQLSSGNPVMVHRGGTSEHWVVVYGYDGSSSSLDWTGFKIMSPNYSQDRVWYQHLNNLVSTWDSLNSFMYRTTGLNNLSETSPAPSSDKAVYNGHTYELVHDYVSWTAARAACQNLGGYLLTINSREEQAFIESLLRSNGVQNTSYWIGLTDKNQEGNWTKWITGETVGYTNWGTGEPDNFDYDLGEQDYATISTGLFYDDAYGWRVEFGQWDDESIALNKYYICEWGDLTTSISENTAGENIRNYTTGDNYPAEYKNATKDSIVDRWNFYNRECTSFVAWCLNSRNGIGFTNQYGGVARWGNAVTWGSVAQGLGITVDNSPAVGAVAWWDSGTYGHVAWVESVDGDNVTIEEYNYAYTGNFNTRTITSSNPTGYIHIADITGGSHGSITASGECGPGATWYLDSNGRLTISGGGSITSHPWDASAVTSVVIGNGITSISRYAFDNCTSLTTITLPASVETIRSYAFNSCTNLQSVTVTTNLKMMESCVFNGCSKLKEVFNLDGLTTAYVDSFRNCNPIRYASLNSTGAKTLGKVGWSFRIPGENYSLRYLFTDGEETGLEVYSVDKDATEIHIIESATSIGESSFYQCTSLPEITIPEHIELIGRYAFDNCTSLTTITLPASVETIRSYAFNSCTNLQSVTVTTNLKMMESCVFNGCSKLKEVFNLDGLTTAYVDSFRNCNPIRYASLNSTGAKTLGKVGWSFRIPGENYSLRYLFTDGEETGLEIYVIDKSATEILITAPITSVNNSALPSGYQLTTVRCYKGTFVADWAAGKGITVVYLDTPEIDYMLPSQLTIIEEEAFAGVENMVFFIPKTVTYIADDAFEKNVVIICEGEGYVYDRCRELGLMVVIE